MQAQRAQDTGHDPGRLLAALHCGVEPLRCPGSQDRDAGMQDSADVMAALRPLHRCGRFLTTASCTDPNLSKLSEPLNPANLSTSQPPNLSEPASRPSCKLFLPYSPTYPFRDLPCHLSSVSGRPPRISCSMLRWTGGCVSPCPQHMRIEHWWRPTEDLRNGGEAGMRVRCGTLEL